MRVDAGSLVARKSLILIIFVALRLTRSIFEVASLQKPWEMSGRGLGFDNLQTELGGSLLEQVDLLVAVSFFVVLHPSVHVLVPPLEHAIDQSQIRRPFFNNRIARHGNLGCWPRLALWSAANGSRIRTPRSTCPSFRSSVQSVSHPDSAAACTTMASQKLTLACL
jgi:hypothetical protein